MDVTALKERWVNPRRKRTWAIAGVLLYTLLGFLLAPWLIKQQLIETMATEYQRTLTVERVRFNPYVLGLQIENLSLQDPDEVVVFSLQTFYINLQLSGLFRGAWTFDEITFDTPYLFFERFDPEDTRLSRMLAVPLKAPNAGELDADTTGFPGLLVYKLTIKDGHLAAEDHVPARPVRTSFEPINIVINDLNTLPNRAGNQAVEIAMPGGGSLTWTGDLALVPLRSKGSFTLDNVHPGFSLAYIEKQFHVDDIQARISGSLEYDVAIDDSGGFSAAIDQLALQVSGIALTGFEPVFEFLGIREIGLSGGSVAYPEQQVEIANLTLSGVNLDVWRTALGEISLVTLLPPSPTGQPTPSPSPSAPWAVTLKQLEILDSSIAFEDRFIEPVARLPLAINRLSITNLSNVAGSRASFLLDSALADGSLSASGAIDLDTPPLFAGDIEVSQLPLRLVSPYIEQRVRTELLNGSLTASLSATLDSQLSPSINGGLEITDLELRDKLVQDTLFSWKNLALDRFEYSDAGVKVSSVAMTEPFARLAIDEAGGINVSRLMIAQPSEETVDTAPLNLTIGRVSLSSASLDFSDASLPLPFHALIHQLNGSISTVTTLSTKPAIIEMEGQVNDYGLSQISGTLNTFDPANHTNIELIFRNLSLSDYSPYTASFAGREIASGKMELNLKYQIDSGQLQGEHDLTLTNLTLGDRVDHPDASSLPLGLAVSLLKDANGVIELDLPVSGDMNDPEFKIGGIILKAFSNLLTKLVSAPFRLLGNLIGVTSEDLGNIEFEPGRADLTLPEIEKIVNLIRGLGERPELSLVIAGVADRRLDEPALKSAALRAEVIARLESEYEPGKDMLDEEIVEVLEAILGERRPDLPLDEIKTPHMTPPADNAEGRLQLDELAYVAELRDRLLASVEITDSRLIELANERAKVIKGALLLPPALDNPGMEGLPAGRLVENRSMLAVQSEDAERIVVALSVQ